MLGAVIHLGAGARTLAMQGHVWDLSNLSRGEVSTTAAMLSEATGIHQEPRGNRKRRKHHNRKDKPASG